MNASEVLQAAKQVFLDTSPIIYFVEENKRYLAALDAVFERVDKGIVTAVTSPVTLAECLVGALKHDRQDQAQVFAKLIANGPHTVCTTIDSETATRAAELRVLYNVSLADAFQIAAAITTGCDVFLTNDAGLRRVKELKVVVLDDVI